MKTIATKTRLPNPEKPGSYQYLPRKAKEVYDELEAALKKADLVPDEYFDMAHEFKYRQSEDADFPEMEDLLCIASYGGSEGIYIDVTIKVSNEKEKRYDFVPFAIGKTLGEDKRAFDRMQYIAGCIYRLFMDDGCHARYMLVASGQPKKDQNALCNRINDEFTELLKQNLYAGQRQPQEYAEELALKAIILKVLSQNTWSEEKLEELLAMENILDGLQKMCKSMMAVNLDEIEDLLASCRSFLQEGASNENH